MKIELLRYDQINEIEYNGYISEWEKTNEHVVPAASNRKGKSFSELVQKWKEDETDLAYKNGFVPSTLYFGKDKNNQIVGAIHFRHSLNERLLQNGGHIGYGTKITERRKGYAFQMLSLLLVEIKSSGLKKVLITCDDDNVASIKTIEKCNGKLENKVIYEKVLTRRYWIEL